MSMSVCEILELCDGTLYSGNLDVICSNFTKDTRNLNVGDTYTEAGATAKDEKDGDISSKISISGSVNTSKAGKYTITYSVKNSSGKTATKTRTITVKAKEPVKEPEKPTENTTGDDKKNTTQSGGDNTTSENTTNAENKTKNQ